MGYHMSINVSGNVHTLNELCPETMQEWKDACLASLTRSCENKKYQVILADPPWRYRNAKDILGKMSYPTMALKELKQLPVRQLADDTSVLFLWATGPLLDSAMELMQAWGFKYKTVFLVWTKRSSKGTPAFGCGWWSRPSTEFLLCGVRGGNYMKWKQTCTQRQELEALRQRHSAKPPEARRIVRDFFDVPNRLELFARDQAPGFDAWGLEINGYFATYTGKEEDE